MARDKESPRETTLPKGCEVLLLEDDALLRQRLAAHLRAAGAVVTETGRLEEVRRLAREVSFDFAALDLHLPDGEGLALVRETVFSENTVVVAMTAFGGVKKAVEAIRLGVGDYLAKPFEPEELILAFLRCRRDRSAARREAHVTAIRPADGLFFGESLARVRSHLDTILAMDRRVGQNLPPVLVEGETGTGKTALARWLHRQGPRAERPLVIVNCAALPEELIESELFGHERGAFTDARQARMGLFEAADNGTLFLDEIGTLPLSAQAKILLAIEDGIIRRLGSNKEIAIDTRIIAASNRPLRELVAAGKFREDLYHRLDLLPITLPPLRERGSDVVAIARHLLSDIVARHHRPGLDITPEGAARLQAQAWRGNIRELAHEIERAVIFNSGEPLDFAHLAPGSASARSSAVWRNPAWTLPESGFSLDGAVNELIAEALRSTGNNVSAAARRLGVTRDFIRYRLEGGEKPAE